MTTKLLIVDDSIVVRKTLSEILSKIKTIEIVGEAKDGKEAIILAKKYDPDVITMDIHMPGGGGIQAIQTLIEESPIPILILTVSSSLSEKMELFQLLNYGFIELMEKPNIVEWSKNPEYREKFLLKIMELANLKSQMAKKKHKKIYTPEKIEVVGIVSSTGGPKILKVLFSKLNENIKVPILCVQHISAGFSEGLIKWLGHYSNLPIKLAYHGEIAQKGRIYFPPDDFHMEIKEGLKIVLHKKPPILGLRPAGDYLFSSMKVFKDKALGIILTGMGSDGTKGLSDLYAFNGYVIAQDKASSIVWGMPKSAIEANIVDEILSVDKIIDRINKLV